MLNVTRLKDREWYTAKLCIGLVRAQIMQHSYWTDGHQPETSLVFHKYCWMRWMITNKWTETVVKLRVVYHGAGGDGSR